MSVWLCAGLWMLVHLSVYRHYLDVCMHIHSCVCVCETSHLRPVQKQEDVEAPGSRPPVTHHSPSLSLFFFNPFLSIDRHV